jgi:hypothetical protein
VSADDIDIVNTPVSSPCYLLVVFVIIPRRPADHIGARTLARPDVPEAASRLAIAEIDE